jgi:hypothetical protein
MNQDALYLEADEDITSAIDKLHKTAGATVQIVVPKRSTLLQSIINQKLLKKAAEATGKQLVLVTGDRVAVELAGRVGLAVAAAVNARPTIRAAAPAREPEMAEDVIDDNEAVAEAVTAVDEKNQAPEKVKKQRPMFTHRDIETQEPIERVAGEEMVAEAEGWEGEPPAAASAPASGLSAARSAKPPKVPNFGRLQKSLLWGFLLVIAVVGYFVGMYFMTTAKVTLFVAASKVSVNTSFTADPAATTSTDKAVLAAQTVKIEKDLTGPVAPTGQKDAGTKAGGTVTVKNCEDSNTHTLKAGSVFTSQGKNFVSDADVTIGAAAFSGGGTKCTPGVGTVHVTASENGDTYNLTSATFTSALLSSNFTTTGSMSGGTSKMLTVVTQDDVDKAKTDALAKDKDASLAALAGKVPAGYRAVDGSQAQTPGTVTPTPAVGEQATAGNVTVHVVYSELAVSSAEFKTMLDALEQKQVGIENQIYEDGLQNVKTTATGGDATGARTFKLTADAYGGAKIDAAVVAKSLAGKQFGNAMDIAGKVSGVQRVEIIMQPPWAANLPNRVNQIKVTIKVNGIGN